MKSILGKVSNDLSNILTLIFGNSFAALFPILLAPVLTRIYTEEEFGVYTIFLAFITILTSFSTGRYDLAILESKTKIIAKHLAFLAIIISLIVAGIFFIGIVILKIYLPDIKYLIILGDLLFLIPLAIILVSALQIVIYVLNREKEFGHMAVSKMIRTGSGTITQVVGGVTNLGSFGLILGKITGDMISLFYGLILIYKREILNGIEIRTSRLKYVANRYSKYLRVNSFHAFVNVLTTSAIPLTLGYFFTVSIVGYYGLSFSVCFLPVTLISQAFFQIFSREISIRIESNDGAYEYFIQTSKKLILISGPLFLILFFFGEFLFTNVFGSNWEKSGSFAEILSPFLFTSFVVSPFTFVALRLNKHVYTFKLEIIGAILKISSILIGAIFFDEIIAITLYSLSGILVNTYLFFWIKGLLKFEVDLLENK